MLSDSFILKLVLAPLIISVATLVSRRWGSKIGGLMIGLPLTSAPVSIFFTLEQGRDFAARAAVGSLLGLIPVAFFCAGYAQASRRLPWYAAASLSISLYFVTIWGVSLANPGFWPAAILVPAALALGLWSLKSLDIREVPIPSPHWDLPLRMAMAAALLIFITTAADRLGPTWSGLLSPFPVMSFVMVTFAHRQAGAPAAWRFIEGVLTGLFGFYAFFLVVTLLIERVNPALAYSLATLTALGVNGVSLARVVWTGRSAHATGY